VNCRDISCGEDATHRLKVKQRGEDGEVEGWLAYCLDHAKQMAGQQGHLKTWDTLKHEDSAAD
jgi:hypothetical protein